MEIPAQDIASVLPLHMLCRHDLRRASTKNPRWRNPLQWPQDLLRQLLDSYLDKYGFTTFLNEVRSQYISQWWIGNLARPAISDRPLRAAIKRCAESKIMERNDRSAKTRSGTTFSAYTPSLDTESSNDRYGGHWSALPWPSGALAGCAIAPNQQRPPLSMHRPLSQQQQRDTDHQRP